MPSVTIEVSLSAFSTDDLIDELWRRGRMVVPTSADGTGAVQLLERLYYALSNGDQPAINELARELCALLGDRIV